jgi:hypothetical protein
MLQRLGCRLRRLFLACAGPLSEMGELREAVDEVQSVYAEGDSDLVSSEGGDQARRTLPTGLGRLINSSLAGVMRAPGIDIA